MKWDGFRRSDNVEDYTDTNKPVKKDKIFSHGISINERLNNTNSQLAKDAGSEDILKKGS